MLAALTRLHASRLGIDLGPAPPGWTKGASRVGHGDDSERWELRGELSLDVELDEMSDEFDEHDGEGDDEDNDDHDFKLDADTAIALAGLGDRTRQAASASASATSDSLPDTEQYYLTSFHEFLASNKKGQDTSREQQHLERQLAQAKLQTSVLSDAMLEAKKNFSSSLDALASSATSP